MMDYSRIYRCVSRAILCTILAFGLMSAPEAFADGSIQPNIDLAVFRDAQGNAYMEIYYSIPEAGITYVPDASGQFSCQLVMDLEILHDSQLWANKLWKIEKSVKDTSQVSTSNQVVDVFRYFVEKPGEYEVAMHVKDMHHLTNIDSARAVLQVSDFETNDVAISDIALASNIQKAPEGAPGKLVKNTYEVTPNPTGIFGEGSSSIYYYYEAYNLETGLDENQYQSVCKVVDAQGVEREGLGITYRPKKRIYDSSIEIGKLNIKNLPSGKYRLVYGIAGTDKTMLASKEKIFYVYNPNVQVADAFGNGHYGPLATMTEEELDEEFERLIHLNTKEDRDFYKNLTNADGKREFIYSIWARPNDENLPPLLFREQYLGRARYADDQFKSVYSPGWRSDRGRVFVLYGVPSNVERFPSTETTVPYQVWTYDKLKGQGAVQFVFADPTGFSKYELLHSDLRGERRNDSWKMDIYRGSNEREFRR